MLNWIYSYLLSVCMHVKTTHAWLLHIPVIVRACTHPPVVCSRSRSSTCLLAICLSSPCTHARMLPLALLPAGTCVATAADRQARGRALACHAGSRRLPRQISVAADRAQTLNRSSEEASYRRHAVRTCPSSEIVSINSDSMHACMHVRCTDSWP